ncbi:MAG: hypothetical protein ABL955_11545, partial [Elusimicrobiota bacterium]
MSARLSLISALLIIGPSAARAGVVAGLRTLPGAPVPVITLSAPQINPITFMTPAFPSLAPALTV